MKPRTDTKKHENENENEFTLGGKRYVARGFNPCKGCVFSSFPGKCSLYARPHCDSERRKDGRNVVFVCAGKADSERRRPRGGIGSSRGARADGTGGQRKNADSEF